MTAADEWIVPADALLRDGAIIVPGFLTAEDCDTVNRFADAIAGAPGLAPAGVERTVLSGSWPAVLHDRVELMYRRLRPLHWRWACQLAALVPPSPGDTPSPASAARPALEVAAQRIRLGPGARLALSPAGRGLLPGGWIAVIALSEPGRDYVGGEMVVTEVRPRQQSQPRVFAPRRGDLLLRAAGARAVIGARGTQRAWLRDGIGRVRAGTLGLLRVDLPESA